MNRLGQLLCNALNSTHIHTYSLSIDGVRMSRCIDRWTGPMTMSICMHGEFIGHLNKLSYFVSHAHTDVRLTLKLRSYKFGVIQALVRFIRIYLPVCQQMGVATRIFGGCSSNSITTTTSNKSRILGIHSSMNFGHSERHIHFHKPFFSPSFEYMRAFARIFWSFRFGCVLPPYYITFMFSTALPVLLAFQINISFSFFSFFSWPFPRTKKKK